MHIYIEAYSNISGKRGHEFKKGALWEGLGGGGEGKILGRQKLVMLWKEIFISHTAGVVAHFGCQPDNIWVKT